MGILNYLDIILTCAVVLISAAVFARHGQIEHIRALLSELSENIEVSDFYKGLPRLTRLLVSGKTVEKLKSEKDEDSSI